MSILRVSHISPKSVPVAEADFIINAHTCFKIIAHTVQDFGELVSHIIMKTYNHTSIDC